MSMSISMLKDTLLKELRPSAFYTSLKEFQGGNQNAFMDKERIVTEKTAILKQFGTQIRNRAETIKDLDSVNQSDIVATVIDVIIDDAFSHETDHPMFTVVYSTDVDEERKANEAITRLFEEDMEAMDMEGLLSTILEDVLFYGEYFVRLVLEKNKGVVEIQDDVDITNTIAMYRFGKPKIILEKLGEEIYQRSPDEIVQFCVAPRITRVKLEKTMLAAFQQVVPKTRLSSYMRTGRSVIWPALALIKQAQLLDLAATADTLKRILAPVVAQVGVPATASPEDLIKITERYENVLSDSFANLSSSTDLSLETVVSLLTTVRVLPSFSDSKGQITTLDLNASSTSPAEAQEATRNAIAQAIGIPPFYLSITQTGTSSKIEILKTYARYSRKLQSLQDSISDGLKDILLTHYKAKRGVELDRRNLKIRFKELISVEQLDFIELMVAAASGINDIYDVLSKVTEEEVTGLRVNKQSFKNLVNGIFSMMEGVDSLVEEVPVEEEVVEPVMSDSGEEEDFDFGLDDTGSGGFGAPGFEEVPFEGGEGGAEGGQAEITGEAPAEGPA